MWIFFQLNEADASDHSQKSETKDNTEEEEEVKEEEIIQHTGTRPKNKQKKKKKHYQHQTVDNSDEEFFLHETNDNGSKQRNPASLKLPAKKCTLSLDQKHLNPDNELKKIFGSRVVQVNQKRKVRGRVYVKSSWLVAAKPNWAQIKKTGLFLTLKLYSYIFFFFNGFVCCRPLYGVGSH